MRVRSEGEESLRVPCRSGDERMHIGASWYPEMWPESEWVKDVARMREVGFTLVRVFEFAWHRFEPAEGRYDFDWACRVMDLCHKHGLQVMVGTPTAAPPAWLTSRYPEVLRTAGDGSRAEHGQRCHFNFHSQRYRELAGKLIERMAQVFARHPALHSWQIDNEMGGMDYGVETLERFHEWLKTRYGTIETLNQRWGLEFWSQAYDSFEQVPLVTSGINARDIQERHHPSLAFACARFQNQGWTEYIGHQVGIIRRDSDKPVAANITGFVGGMDWAEHRVHLDRVGASMYADRRYYHYNLPRFDYMRTMKGYAPYWLMETAPNWSAGARTWNIHYDEQGPKLFCWLSTILGGSMTLFWQWREHWAGQEMLHGTCVSATGRWRPNKESWAWISRTHAEHGGWLLANPPMQARVGLLMTCESAWSFGIDPTDDGMDYASRFRDDWHGSLCRAQIWRDVVPEDADFAPYKVLALPMMPIVSESTRVRLKEWVRSGGTLLLGPLTGWRSEEYTAFTDREFGGFEELMGATSALRFTVQWVEDRVQIVFADGHKTRTKTMCDGYECHGAEVW